MDMFAHLSDESLEEELEKAVNKRDLFNMKELNAYNAGQSLRAAIFRIFAERWDKRADEILVTMATR